MKRHPIHLHSIDRACGHRDGSRQRHWQGGPPAIGQLWGRCAGKQPASSRGQNEQFFLGKELSLPSACGGMATPRSHLANEFHQIQFVNYYMSVTFFVIVKSVKRC